MPIKEFWKPPEKPQELRQEQQNKGFVLTSQNKIVKSYRNEKNEDIYFSLINISHFEIG